MAYTPGEWKYGVRKDGSIWLSIGNPKTGPHRQGDLHASEDDARLIVAAPDTLKALKDALPLIDSKGRKGVDIMRAAQAAVAKAEGRA